MNTRNARAIREMRFGNFRESFPTLRSKISILAAFLIVVFAGMATGATTSVTLAWNASTTPTVTGYNVHYGTTSEKENLTKNAGKVTTTAISGLTVGLKYYFKVKAYNAARLESAPSNELSFTAVATATPTPRATPEPTPTPKPPATPVPTPTPGTPVAKNDTGLIATKNTPLLIPASKLLANDADPNGYTLAISAVANATNGAVSYNATTKTVTFAPTPATYTGPASFYYTVTNGHGGKATALVSITVNLPTSSLFSALDTSTALTANDGRPIELGVKFKTSKAGVINGILFYKNTQNTGLHVGNLWSATGRLLSTATFANETASGWQRVSLPSPVALTAGTIYVVSYHSNSYYSVEDYFFNTAFSNGTLTAPDNASTGGNGVYVYGSGGIFPASTNHASNYWVDVIFTPANP